MTVARLLLRSAQLWGDRPALIDAARGRTISFAQAVEAIFFFGQGLRRRGLEAGDRVAILADATADYLAADYGSMSAGLVRVPLDPSLSADELANQIRDAEARLLLFDGQRAGLAAVLIEKTGDVGIKSFAIDMDVFDHPRDGILQVPIGDEDIGLNSLASLNYTGGTSGQPKAVMLSHGNLSAIVQNIVMARAMGPGDVMVNMRPLWPIAGVIVLAHLAAGGTVVLGGRFEGARMVSLLDEYRAAATSMVPNSSCPRAARLPTIQAAFAFIAPRDRHRCGIGAVGDVRRGARRIRSEDRCSVRSHRGVVELLSAAVGTRCTAGHSPSAHDVRRSTGFWMRPHDCRRIWTGTVSDNPERFGFAVRMS